MNCLSFSGRQLHVDKKWLEGRFACLQRAHEGVLLAGGCRDDDGLEKVDLFVRNDRMLE